MTYEDICKYIDLLKKINPKKIILIGGEPTIHPNFAEIVDVLYSAGFSVAVVSNGVGFANIDVAEKTVPKLNSIALSIDGTPELHNLLVDNNNAYECLSRAMFNIQKINPKIICSVTVVTKENIHNINENINVLYEKGIRRFSFNICTSLEKSEFSYSPRTFAQVFVPVLKELLSQYKDASFTVVTPIQRCLIPKELQGYFKYSCHIFSDSGLIIDANNDILLCTHWGNYPLAKISLDITFEEFKVVWDKLGIYRREVSVLPLTKCSECIDKNNCYGGCPVFWRTIDPEKEL